MPLPGRPVTTTSPNPRKEEQIMQQPYIQMNRTEFITNYTIIKNPFSDPATSDPYTFHPEGEELGFVRSHHPGSVWTKVIGIDNRIWLYSGYHYEHRLGFLLTKQSIAPHTRIEVQWN